MKIYTHLMENLYTHNTTFIQLLKDLLIVFNGINYAALNKDNGSRRTFVPKNDELVEIDISAYHPTLIAGLVGYEFGDVDIHQHFADLYEVDYKKSKELTFKQLYGGVFKEYEHIEFFKKTKKYIKELHQKYNEEGIY